MYPSFIHNYAILFLERVDSTNNYAAMLEKQSNVQHKTVILTSFQEKGRGQNQNSWQAKEGENLLFSLYIKPTSVAIKDQFTISRISALALYDCLNYFLQKKPSIKWPNDLFVGDKKIAGMLIENSLKEKELERSIIGIGLNVNQMDFGDLNATSLKKESRQDWQLQRILEYFLDRFDHYLGMLSDVESIHRSFDSKLRFFEEWHIFKKSKVGPFEGRILGTSNEGELIVEDEFHRHHRFQHKEIDLS